MSIHTHTFLWHYCFMPVVSKSSPKLTRVSWWIAVVGLNNPNAFCIGDTIYTGPKRVFPGIPSFSPELFCYMRNPNPSKYKQFVKGLNELLGEGAVQVTLLSLLYLYIICHSWTLLDIFIQFLSPLFGWNSLNLWCPIVQQVLYSIDGGRTDPILAAVGQLQFEVCIQFIQYAVFSTIAVKDTLKTSFGQASLSSNHSTWLALEANKSYLLWILRVAVAASMRPGSNCTTADLSRHWDSRKFVNCKDLYSQPGSYYLIFRNQYT